MAATSIQWCDHSINPIRARDKKTGAIGHYCEKCASGCTNCYASDLQRRFKMPAFGSGQKRGDIEVFLDESKLEEVRKRKKPTRYFWCDMSDLFGSWVKPEWIEACLETMDETPQHTHMLLTKRPENVRPMMIEHSLVKIPGHVRQNEGDGYHVKSRPNVWIGCSVATQADVDKNIPELLKCRSLTPVLFVSAEPLLGPVDFSFGTPEERKIPCQSIVIPPKLDWVIVGGESGSNARPCEIDWIRSLVHQCQVAEVPCFVKQLGSQPRFGEADIWAGAADIRLDKKGGDPDEWPSDMRIREFPDPYVKA